MIGVALQAAAAFNLVCSVVTTGMPSRRSTLVMRVDLQSMRYCMERCAQTLPIKRVSESEIVFHDGMSEYSNTIIRRRVNRESGQYWSSTSSRFGGRAIETDSHGRCEAAPFTGFPAPRF